MSDHIKMVNQNVLSKSTHTPLCRACVVKKLSVKYFSNVHSLEIIEFCSDTLHVYTDVKSCHINTYYTLTHGKINLNQLYLFLHRLFRRKIFW